MSSVEASSASIDVSQVAAQAKQVENIVRAACPEYELAKKVASLCIIGLIWVPTSYAVAAVAVVGAVKWYGDRNWGVGPQDAETSFFMKQVYNIMNLGTAILLVAPVSLSSTLMVGGALVAGIMHIAKERQQNSELEEKLTDAEINTWTVIGYTAEAIAGFACIQAISLVAFASFAEISAVAVIAGGFYAVCALAHYKAAMTIEVVKLNKADIDERMIDQRLGVFVMEFIFWLKEQAFDAVSEVKRLWDERQARAPEDGDDEGADVSVKAPTVDAAPKKAEDVVAASVAAPVVASTPAVVAPVVVADAPAAAPEAAAPSAHRHEAEAQ